MESAYNVDQRKIVAFFGPMWYHHDWPGDGTHHKKRRPLILTWGVTPIEKNVRVMDEKGNLYESTWPKRARGLVKSGRARFIDENTICLASPPNFDLEEHEMSDTTTNGNVMEYSIPWLLRQIAAMQTETAYIHEAIEKLNAMSDGDSGEPGSPGNIQGWAKAEALGDIVKSRETTNQQLLNFYNKVYDDLSGRPKLVTIAPSDPRNE